MIKMIKSDISSERERERERSRRDSSGRSEEKDELLLDDLLKVGNCMFLRVKKRRKKDCTCGNS